MSEGERERDRESGCMREWVREERERGVSMREIEERERERPGECV